MDSFELKYLQESMVILLNIKYDRKILVVRKVSHYLKQFLATEMMFALPVHYYTAWGI